MKLHQVFCKTKDGTHKCEFGFKVRADAEKLAIELRKKYSQHKYFVRGTFN
jgi:hypothetical protein